jgi:hypothetical protein
VAGQIEIACNQIRKNGLKKPRVLTFAHLNVIAQRGEGETDALSQRAEASVLGGLGVSVLMSLKFSTVLNSMLNSPKFCHR